jgi:hypothetical protein
MDAHHKQRKISYACGKIDIPHSAHCNSEQLGEARTHHIGIHSFHMLKQLSFQYPIAQIAILEFSFKASILLQPSAFRARMRNVHTLHVSLIYQTWAMNGIKPKCPGCCP